MAISRIGATNAASATITGPSGSAGDIIIYDLFRSTAATIPTLDAQTALLASSSGSTCAYLTAWEFCSSGTPSARTFTGATQAVATRYSGVLGLGAISATAIASSATMSYAGLTLIQGGGTSWIKAFGAHRTASNVNVAPTGMSTYTNNSVGTGPELAAFDTNGPVSGWTTETVTVNATSGRACGTLELLGAASTINPFDKNSAITLSNSDLTGTISSAAASADNARVSLGQASGKYVFGVTPNSTTAGVSLGNLASALTGYSSADSVAVFIYGTLSYEYPGIPGGVATQLGDGVAYTGGTKCYFAVDLTNELFWFGFNAGSGMVWNRNGSANPDTGTGGISYSNFTGGLGVGYPLINLSASGDALTWDGTAAGSGLSTFTPWDGAAAAVSVTLPPNTITSHASSPSKTAQKALSTVALTSHAGSFVPTQGKSVSLSGVSIVSHATKPTIRGDASKTLLPNTAIARTGTFTVQGSVSKSMAGVSVTSHVGSLLKQIQKTLTGATIIAHPGSFLISRSTTVNLTAQQMTLHAGSFAPTTAKLFNLTGVSATTHAGSLLPSIAKALSATGAVVHVGAFTVITGKVINLTGVGMASHAGTLGKTISKTLSPVTILAHAGTFAESTSKTIILPAQQIAAHAGSFAKIITVTLPSPQITARAGTFAINIGGNITINLVGFKVVAHAGSFVKQQFATLHGTGAISHAGQININFTKLLSGANAIIHVGQFTPATGKAVNLTGAGMTLRAGRPLSSLSTTMSAGMVMYTGHFTILAPSTLGIATALDFALFSSQAVDLALFAAINQGIIQ